MLTKGTGRKKRGSYLLVGTVTALAVILQQISLTGSPAVSDKGASNVGILNGAPRVAWYLNGDFKTAEGLGGTFLQAGSKIYYTNPEGFTAAELDTEATEHGEGYAGDGSYT